MRINIQYFADSGTQVNTTTGTANAYTGAVTANGNMSPEMKVFWDTTLLENSRQEHYFAQFGRKQPLPAHAGKTVEWRKMDTLPVADVLKEGVIPTGKQVAVRSLTGGIQSLGMYITISDELDTHSVDPLISSVVEELAASAGQTQDLAVRNALAAGTNVLYADNVASNGTITEVTTRRGLTAACKLTPDVVNQAYTILTKMKAPKINGKYIALIHPSVTYDLRQSPEWIEAHKYARPEEIFNGEIGELHNVRFIQTNNAPVWSGEPLNGDTARYLEFASTTGYADSTGSTATYGTIGVKKIKYTGTLATGADKALVGRYVNYYDDSASAYTDTAVITGIDTANNWLFLDSAVTPTPEGGAGKDRLYPGEGGAEGTSDTNGTAVYGCIFLGRDAFGMIDPEGAGLEMIIKTRDQIGGPLNQYSTVGYKLSVGNKILYEERILRVEVCSKFSPIDKDNTADFKEAV